MVAADPYVSREIVFSYGVEKLNWKSCLVLQILFLYMFVLQGTMRI